MNDIQKKKPQDNGVTTLVTERPGRRLTRSSTVKIKRSGKRKLILNKVVGPFAIFVGTSILTAVIDGSVQSIFF